jgi:putative tryptophan/tyrosine transport system substrate-binding protein
MRRREFIALLGGVTTFWPLAAGAQQTNKLRTIGFLGADAPSWNQRTAAFVLRLGELGWIEGRTVAIEYRWTEGRSERIAEFAAEFVRRNVDVIVTLGGAVATLKRATTVIPIVFAVANDPIGSGLVTSLSRPGGNVTGLSLETTDIAGKRVELLREIVPDLRRLAIMFDGGYSASVSHMREVQAVAQTLGIGVEPQEIRRAEDLEPPLFELLKRQADALYVAENSLIQVNGTRIAALALSARLPTIFGARDQVQAGGLMSYGPIYPDLFRRAAEFVDKILHGTKPGDIPVEQPTRFELVVNLKTAKFFGLTVPQTLLATADEVIE